MPDSNLSSVDSNLGSVRGYNHYYCRPTGIHLTVVTRLIVDLRTPKDGSIEKYINSIVVAWLLLRNET